MTRLYNYWIFVSFSLTTLSSMIWPMLPSWLWVSSLGILCFWIRGLKWGAGIAFGVALILTHSQILSVQKQMIFKFGTDITITAKVDSFFKPSQSGYSGTAKIHQINEHGLNPLFQPRVYLRAPVPLLDGEVVRFHVKVKPIYGVLNDVGYDAEKQAISQRIVARANVQPNSPFMVISTGGIKDKLYRQVVEISRDTPIQGLLLALVFGDRSLINPELWQQLRDSGLAHLVAISGLHIGIAFGVGFLLGGVFSRGHRWLLWSPWLVGFAVAWGYAWLAGFTLPTQRALVMCAIQVLLMLTQVKVSMVWRILLTLSGVLAIDPFAGYSSSFWLSFLAVIMVMVFAQAVHSIRRSWQKALLIQLGMTLGMLPVTGWFFQGVSMGSFLFNLFFIPWFSLILVPLVFLLLSSLLFLGGLTQLLWLGVTWGFTPLLWGLPLSAGGWLPLNHQTIVVLMLSVGLWLFRPFVRRTILTALLLIVVLHFAFQTPGKGWNLYVLDVGHGLAVLLEQQGHVVIYDTGSSWDSGSYAQSVILPMLAQRGWVLDGLILSHTDNDHSGGRLWLEEAAPKAWFRASQTIAGYSPCIKGANWWWRALHFEVVWPPEMVSRAKNQHSCVVLVSDIVGKRLLLTGDIDAVGEWLLSRDNNQLKADVMLVPHHGSRTSSTRHFIEKVRPQWAIASVEKGGQWHLPSPSVVDLYEFLGASWLDTADSGQISVNFQTSKITISTKRSDGNQPWYRQMLRNGVE